MAECWVAIQRTLITFANADRKGGSAPKGPIERAICKKFNIKQSKEKKND